MGDVPTEAGLHWWRFPRGRRWWPVQLFVIPARDGDIEHRLARFLLVHELTGRRLQRRMVGVLDAYEMGGEWGGRIPEPPDFSNLPPGAMPQLIWVVCDPSGDAEVNEILFGAGVRVIPTCDEQGA